MFMASTPHGGHPPDTTIFRFQPEESCEKHTFSMDGVLHVVAQVKASAPNGLSSLTQSDNFICCLFTASMPFLNNII